MLPPCQPARTLFSKPCPLSRGANADSGGSGGGRGINKSDPRWVSKMSGDGTNLGVAQLWYAER